MEYLEEIKNWVKKFPVQAILFVMAFCSYPLAIVSPQGTMFFREIFMFKLPMELAMAGLSFCWILKNLDKLRFSKFAVLTTLVILCSATLSLLLNKAHGADFLSSLNFILVLNCVAVSFNDQHNRRGGILFSTLIFTVVLLINYVHFFFFNSIYGIAGNRNWFSALICVSIPFSIAGILLFFKDLKIRIIFSLVLIVPFFIAIYEASSRASYLALCMVLALFISRNFANWAKILLLILLFLFPLVMIKSFPQKFEKFQAGDVRKDLWQGSVAMLADKPLGFGANRFKQNYPPYDTLDHKYHLHHPDETTHPHNQLLLVGIENGILAMFTFAIICLFILKKGQEGDKKDWLFVSGFMILLIQGFFDKALSMPPTSLAFILCGAYLWKDQIQLKVCGDCPNRDKKLIYGSYSFGVVILAQILIDFKAQLNWREANIIFKQNMTERFEEGQKCLEKAVELKPRDIDFKYGLMRGYESSLKRPDLALIEAKNIAKIAPNYRRIDRHLAYLHDVDKNLEKAEFYREEDQRIFPAEINALIDLINLKIRLGKSIELPNLFSKLDENIKNYSSKISLRDGVYLINERESWLNKKTFKDWYTFSNKIIGPYGFKEARDNFFNFINIYPDLNIYYSGSFNSLDVQYWIEILKINSIFKDLDTAESLNFLKENVEINNKEIFKNPVTLLKSKLGSQLSYYSLASVVLRLKQISSALIFEGKEAKGLIFVEDNKVKIFDNNGINLFNKLEGNQRLLAFYYPQNCALRNYILSKILNRDNNFFNISVWPIIDIIKFNNQSKLRIEGVIPHPFTELNKKLQ